MQIRQANAISGEGETIESDSSECFSMCKIAEGRLYKIVKWCKSLPLFRHISVSFTLEMMVRSVFFFIVE